MPKVDLILPDFIIIGANKAGTTSVARYLNQHPEIKMATVKEPMFFVADPAQPVVGRKEASLSKPFFATDLFSYSELFSGWKEDALAFGEASTAYLCNPQVAAPEIRRIVPNVKLIAILRHPVDRAISAYKMARGSGIETRDLGAIIADSFGNVNILRRQGVKEYIRNGLYGKQLEVFLRYFEPDQFLFLTYDALLRDAGQFLRTICAFIGVSPAFKFDVSRHYNPASDHGGERIVVQEEIYQELQELFTEDIGKTARLTGIDLSHWLRATKEQPELKPD